MIYLSSANSLTHSVPDYVDSEGSKVLLKAKSENRPAALWLVAYIRRPKAENHIRNKLSWVGGREQADEGKTLRGSASQQQQQRRVCRCDEIVLVDVQEAVIAGESWRAQSSLRFRAIKCHQQHWRAQGSKT